jgi:hypothetical protein
MAGTVAAANVLPKPTERNTERTSTAGSALSEGLKAAPAASLQTANWPVSPESDVVARGVDGVVVGTGDDKALNDDVVGAGGDAGARWCGHPRSR